MAEKNRVVGRDNCSTLKLVQKLSSSDSFHLLFDKWEDVAQDLEIDQVAIKTWKKNFFLGKDSFKTVVTTMLETWVGQKGSKAYLDDLLKALTDNGMVVLAELLQGEFGCLPKHPKDYIRFPQTLTEFFSAQSKNYTIISTPDSLITNKKIQENSKDCLLFNTIKFLEWASMNWDSTPEKDLSYSYVVTVTTLDEIKKVLEAAKAFPEQKLLIITGEPEEKLNEFAGTFKIVKDEMEWGDLSPIFQFEVEERLKQQVGMSLQNLSETVFGQVLVDLINKLELKLFENTIPEELLVSYYISRVIIKRTALDQEKLFKDNSIDNIFLFTGLNKIELRGYVRTGMTGNSSEALNTKISKDSRFIVLQNPTHFPIICRNNSNKSVHWIELKDEEFHWVKTCGEIKSIQGMIKINPPEELLEGKKADEEDATEDKDEEKGDVEFREEELVDKITLSNDTRVFCLSDTPGMGKSVLLAKIGKKLKDKFQSKKVVIFLLISDVLKLIKELDNKNLELALHELACKNNLEKEIICNRITSSELEIELLLDGFDEVELERIDFAFKLLRFIKGFNSIRLWVGTRPQHLEKIEQKLNTIGYNIQPFNKKEQVNFLKSFWTSQNHGLDNTKLKTFALKVLETLSSTTARNIPSPNEEVEIAGIPLQCHMLAQIYEENAVLFCSLKIDGYNTENLPLLPEINSVGALYDAVVSNKFKKYQETYSQLHKLNRSSLYSMHSKLALQLIFPDWFNESLCYLFKETVKTEELLNVGLLERKVTSNANSFIHRTYAEYFCAYFVAENIFKIELVNKKIIDFFYDGFLFIFEDDSDDDGDDDHYDDEYYTGKCFRDFISCYFLNHLVLNRDTLIISNCSLSPELTTKVISPENKLVILLACSNHNFLALFNLFTELFKFEENCSDIIDEKFFFHSIKHHGFKMFEIILSHFKKHSRFSTRLSSRALHAAVASLDSLKLEYFIKVEGLFGKLLGKPDVELGTLFETYFGSINLNLHGFRNKTEWVNVDKIDTIRLLIEIEKGIYTTEEDNPLRLQNQTCNWHWAFLNKSTSFLTRLELIKLGANILQTDKKGNNFLHRHGNSNTEFLKYFEAISPKKLKLLVQKKNDKGLTPLARAFKKHVLFSRECIEKWKEAGTDFNEVFNGTPLFLLAIQSGNGKEVLQFMIDNGVDVHWRNDQTIQEVREMKTYMDYAAELGNLDAVQLLVREYGMDVNGINENPRSSLDYLIHNWDINSSKEYFRTAQELWKLGERLKKTSPGHLAKLAAQLKDELFLKFVLDSGIDVNKVEANGNNLLHVLVKEWHNAEAIEMALEAGADPSAKNKNGLTPLDLALKHPQDITLNFCNILQLLKPPYDFKWLSVSPLVRAEDFKRILLKSEPYNLDKNEFLSLFEQFIQRSSNSTEKNICLHSLFKSGSLLSHSEFGWITEYLSKDRDRVQLFKIVDERGATPLHYAVKNINGIQEKTFKALQKIIDFKLKDKNGKSLLFYAVDGEQAPEFLELLNKYGRTDLLDADNKGQNLLHVTEDLDTVKFLLKKGVDPNWVDRNGDTPLHKYIQKLDYFHAEISSNFIEVLLEGGAKAEIKNNKGETFFDIAKSKFDAFDGIGKVFTIAWKFGGIPQKLSVDDITEVVFHHNNNLTSEDFIYFTNEILKLQHLEKEDEDYEDHFPFEEWRNHLKSSNFHLLVENLIKNGRVDFFFAQTQKEKPALHYIVSTIRVEERTLKLLQENKIDLGVKDAKGWSLLFQAINTVWIQLSLKDFKLLVEYDGGNMSQIDKFGKNLLHVAVNKNGGNENSILVEYLLEKVGLDPNKVDNDGNTPLHILLANIYVLWNADTFTIVQLFMESGANIFIKNSKEETVEDLADRIQDKDSLKEHLLAILSASKEF